ncbi:MAG: ATP-binding protein [Planctomycetota bacterium]
MTHADPDNEASFNVCVVPSRLAEIALPKQRILDELAHFQYAEEASFAMKLALEEALTNAVRHGNRCDPSKRVTVRYAVNERKAVVTVRDEGGGFALDKVPDCTSAERLSTPNGRGIMLMRAYMDELCYRDQGREVYFSMLRQSTRRPCSEKVPPSPVRRTVYFTGRVQGVGFRNHALQVASRLNVTGYVRNLPDGRVELVAEGHEELLDQLVQQIECDMKGCIADICTCASPATGQFHDFHVAG